MFAQDDRDEGLALPADSTEILHAWRDRARTLVKFDGKQTS